jgi:hypothetical protein
MANQQASSDVERVGKPSATLASAVRDGARAAEQTGKDTVETIAAGARETASRIDETAQDAAKDIAAAGDLLRDTSDFAADRMNALFSSYAVLANGAQQLQHTMLAAWQQSWETAASSPGEFLQCRSLTDVATLQRDLLRRGIDGWLDANTRLLKLSGSIAERAVEPIADRIAH